jgi:LysR family transcriptional regulator, low CO2-responsive transcriptional regulator
MLDLNALHTFLAVAEHGNFSEAGRRLHLTQPAISQTIEGLERHFGVRLFLRQGRVARLTEEGQVLEPAARELLAAATRLEESMASLQGEVIGEMVIGCSTTSGKYLLPGLIARFRKLFPRVRINVLISSRDGVMNRLLSGEVAFGVTSKQIDHRDLEYQEFFTDDVILIAPAGHRWAHFGRVVPDDLLDEPVILRETSAGTYDVLMDGLRQHDISPDMLNVAMELGNAEAIEMAVEEGIGVAFVSRLAAARGLELGRIVEVKVNGMALARKIFLARCQKHATSRAQSEFWSFVASQLEQISIQVAK